LLSRAQGCKPIGNHRPKKEKKNLYTEADRGMRRQRVECDHEAGSFSERKKG